MLELWCINEHVNPGYLTLAFSIRPVYNQSFPLRSQSRVPNWWTGLIWVVMYLLIFLLPFWIHGSLVRGPCLTSMVDWSTGGACICSWHCLSDECHTSWRVSLFLFFLFFPEASDLLVMICPQPPAYAFYFFSLFNVCFQILFLLVFFVCFISCSFTGPNPPPQIWMSPNLACGIWSVLVVCTSAARLPGSLPPKPPPGLNEDQAYAVSVQNLPGSVWGLSGLADFHDTSILCWSSDERLSGFPCGMRNG